METHVGCFGEQRASVSGELQQYRALFAPEQELPTVAVPKFFDRRSGGAEHFDVLTVVGFAALKVAQLRRQIVRFFFLLRQAWVRLDVGSPGGRTVDN